MTYPAVTDTPDPAVVSGLLARPVLSRSDTALVTGLSPATIIRAERKGELPARRVGDRVLYATTDVLAWLGLEATP